jgi:hypothetical protein
VWSYSELIVFGDSLSDTGNLASLTIDFPRPYYKNRVLQAKVGEIVDINSAAQLQATGILPQAPTMQDPSLPYGVELTLDEEDIKLGPIPGGAIGTAAIYTDSVTATHIIRKVMVRMEAWMNYLKP